MKIVRRKYSIISLERQLNHIEQELIAISEDAAYLPSPRQMEAMGRMRQKLIAIDYCCEALHEHLWARVYTWQNAP